MKTLICILSLTISSLSMAQVLPKVNKPQELTKGRFSEGVDTKLSPEDIKKYLPWAQSAKKVLTKALADAKIMPISERSRFIKKEVEGVVLRSGSKRYQTLMRHSLNRALFLVDELVQESSPGVKGTLENQLDILMRAIKVGLSFYESDLDYQKRIEIGDSAVEINHAEFGFTLAEELSLASINILDASAQYRTLYKSLEMLNWDLSQDRNARDYSESIWDLYKGLERLPETPSTIDQINIENVRKLNLLRQNNFTHIRQRNNTLADSCYLHTFKDDNGDQCIKIAKSRSLSEPKITRCAKSTSDDKTFLRCLLKVTGENND